MSDNPAPERAHTLIATFGADTQEDLADTLRSMADDIECGRITVGCWGSPSHNAIYSYKVAPQTHDAYFRQVHAYLAERKL